MDANLNFATTPSSNPTPVGASSGAKGLDPSLSKPMNGQEFAGVMRDLMAKGERQELAGTEPKEATDATTAALQTLNLGSQFSVITAASPLPDPNSLAQFARAQGLSESAVQALFGDLTTKPTDISLAQTAEIPSFGGLMGLPVAPVALVAPVASVAPVAPIATIAPSAGSADISTLTILPSATPIGWIQSQPSSLAHSDQVGSSGLTLTPQMATLGAPKASDVSALLATAGATGILKTVSDMGTAPSQALGSADTVDMSPELGPLDAMRMRMVPAWENMTRQLAKLNGTDQAAAWGQLTSNILSSKVLGGDVPEVLLDLGANNPALLSTFDALQDLGSGSGGSSVSTISLDSARNTASTGSLGAAATSAALANPELTDRAAQIQDLADKLGKAMGERLQEQLERGEWKLQLKLNPAHLGKIDVELDMSANGLDAIFKTDNQLTRELIAQGMNKLKDSLAQSGMTVANVWVNSENQRGSGGNSTPRQNSESDNQVSAPVSDVKAAESRIKELRSSDAWDTLA